ncbi:MAG: TraR/DksA C4-type zinc finger protein [Bacillota bacterium]
MNPKTMQRYRERLLALRDKYQRDAEQLRTGGLGESMGQSISEFSTYDNHPADLGTEMFEREKDLGLYGLIGLHLKRIDDALEQIENGTYGRCDICGREIDPLRLEAMPETTLCVRCKEKYDELPYHRPAEEEVLSPPFARSFLDDTDMVEFDGEDAWQEVARVGTSNGPSDAGGGENYEETYYDSAEDRGLVQEFEGLVDQEGDVLGYRDKRHCRSAPRSGGGQDVDGGSNCVLE